MLARNISALIIAAAAALVATPAPAEWKAANQQVADLAKDPKIASVLATVNRLDLALINDDHATFNSLLAPDLVVNNPQNIISARGATASRNTAGLISYSSYVRSVEYAGMLGDMVLLMGDERVIPKGNAPMAGKEVRRRFTDIWRQVGNGWVLAVRQATVVAP